MSRSGSSDIAKGKNFTEQLLYVQHVNKEKDTASKISEQSIWEYFLNNSKIFSDSNFAEYLRNPKANVEILKSSLQDEIVIAAEVCTNPLPATLKTAVTIHAFVVFQTENLKTNNVMCYSMEKNGQYIVLQQSPNRDDVMHKLYDPVEKKLVKRLGPVKRGSFARGNEKELEYLLQAIWETNQLSTKYNLLSSNCQNFAEFVFKEASLGGMKWSTWISRRFGLRNKKSQTEIGAETFNYYERKDTKFFLYKAMAEGRRQKFELLAGNLTTELLNSVDFQGYTLLEWATAFSTSDWPIDQFLIEKGAEIQTDEGTFRWNVFSIALQYLPSNDSQYLSFNRIDIRGVNRTGDSALHLALYWKKWDVAERILDRIPYYDVNVTNSLGETPLHLAVHPKCKMVLIKKILARTNSENVNAQKVNGWTALHDAIDIQSEIAVKELLKRDDVDVNLKNNKNLTALHFACLWKNIPVEMFRVILEKTTNVNAQEKGGRTALEVAIRSESEIAVKEMLKRDDVDVNLKWDGNFTALKFACFWNKDKPDLFRLILKKTTDVNAQDKNGDTALHWAIGQEIRTAVEKLLRHKDVDVNIKNKYNYTILHVASVWKNIPIDLFNKILEKSADVVNAQNINGDTALHRAIRIENRTAVEELLKRKDVDVNLKNNKHGTALKYACFWNKDMPIDLFNIILEKSADVNAQDDEYGTTVLHCAIWSQTPTATKELLGHKGVDVNLKNDLNQTALYKACTWVDIPNDLFRLILGKSTDINAKDKCDGNTALHVSIIDKSETATKQLLEREDVDVNLKNWAKRTALHFAAYYKIPIDLFRVILEKTADINAQDKHGNTALHNAIEKKSITAVEELLNHQKVDLNLKNNKNQTALNLCSEWKGIPANLLKIIDEKTSAEKKAEAENEAT